MAGKALLVVVACSLMAKKLKAEQKKREASAKAFAAWKSGLESDEDDEDYGDDDEAEA